MTWGQQQPSGAPVHEAPPVAAGGRHRGTSRSRLRSWLLAGVIAIGFLLAAIVLAAYYGATLGVLTTLLAVL